jgi:hypothetical protein
VPAPGGLRSAIRPPSASTLVLEPDQAGASAEVGAVVADTDPQHAGAGVHLDIDDRGARVLGHLGQRLGDDEVGGDLDRVGQPPVQPDVEADGDGGAAGQHLERRVQAAVGEDGGVDPAGDLAQLVQRAGARPVGAGCW